MKGSRPVRRGADGKVPNKHCLVTASGLPDSLELTDPGFDHTVLSEFRTRLVAQTAEERFLEAVIDLCKERGWLKAGGKQRTDSTHVLARVRSLSNLELVGETLRAVLNDLARVDEEWLIHCCNSHHRPFRRRADRLQF